MRTIFRPFPSFTSREGRPQVVLSSLQRTIALPNLAEQNGNMASQATCPLCNALLPPPRLIDGRPEQTACPRCGERVTPLLREVPTEETPPLRAVLASSQSRRQANRRVGTALLIGMILLATVIAFFLVNTRDKRRLMQLAESPGLAYVPSDSNVILGVNFLESARSALGPETLERLGLRAGGPIDLERLVGLSREQIAVVLFALRVDRNLIPRVWIIVETRARINIDAVRNRLGARASREEASRHVYLATPPALGIETALWFPEARTMLMAYPPAEMASVPLTPDRETRRFAAPIHDLLVTRSQRDSFLWLVAHADDWSNTSLSLSLPWLPWAAGLRPSLPQVQTVGLAWREDKGQTATRARPARITAAPSELPPSVALDLVILTRPEADLPGLIDGLESWVERQRLLIRDQNREGRRFSATITAPPADWEQALEALRRR